MAVQSRHSPLCLSVLILSAAALLVGCDKPPSRLEERAVRVVFTPATEGDVTIFGEYVGRTRASHRVEINPRIDGFLEQRLFVEGSAVKKGAVLFRIDPAPYQAKVDRAKAILSRYRAILAKARRDAARIKPLFEEDAASQLDNDDAIAAVQQGEATVLEAKADVKNTLLELDYTEIKSPIDGLIGESRVDIGALIKSNNALPLTTVSQIDPIDIYFSMSALDYLNARRRVRSYYQAQKIEREGKALEGKVTITLPDETNYKFKGVVGFTAPQVNPQTGTFAIRARAPNPDRELLPGQYTRVRMPLEIKRDALLIPEESILIEQGGVYVYVVLPNNRVERRLIFVGSIVKGKLIVEKGLAAGERIILHGINKVYHGSLVDPITETAYNEELKSKEQAQLQEKATADKGIEEKPAEETAE